MGLQQKMVEVEEVFLWNCGDDDALSLKILGVEEVLHWMAVEVEAEESLMKMRWHS